MSSTGDKSGISEKAIEIYTWVVFAVLCQAINIFGIVTYIINIICFTKQGFGESINITLVGLAVSDLGSLTMMAWLCICLTPAVTAADLSFEPVDVAYLTSAIPHFSFTRVSACLTAMITLERCLCITNPLQIKSIITPNRATLITVSIFIIFFCSGAPVYAVNSLGMRFSPARNATLFGLISTRDRAMVDMISFANNNFAIPLAAFLIIVICTIIISVKLRAQGNWRQKMLNSSNEDRVGNRNQKAAKMVVMISTLFIVCFIPGSVTMLAAGLTPELLIRGKYVNISVIITGFGYVMEGINSSMNIFIYFYMSSVYREQFLKLFFGKACCVVRKETSKN